MTKDDEMVALVPNEILEGTAAKPVDPLYPHFEALAGLLIDLKDKIRQSVKDLPDEEVMRLADFCDKESEPGPDPFGHGTSKNFPMPEWGRVARVLRGEVAMRRACREAEEYIERTGASYYCLHCHGECTPEHLATLR
ncbi:MAG TPA: hypothetical protein VFA98_13295 [Thermoanaerobaculia bacterium]|jgi:hypothetical protein|nr:hypothetical protein [Thermoanaerobaculia bacterium]